MKPIALAFILTLHTLLGFAQTTDAPQILILAPAKTFYDGTLKNAIAVTNARLAALENYNGFLKTTQTPQYKRQPANVKVLMRTQAEFGRETNIFKYVSESIDYDLSELLPGSPGLVLLMKDTTCDGTLASLKQIADAQQLQYVVNIPAIGFYREKTDTLVKIVLQVYDNRSGAIILNKTYTNTPGHNNQCDKDDMQCLVEHALYAARTDLFKTIYNRIPSVVHRRNLEKQRTDTLLHVYYSRLRDVEYLKKMVTVSDSLIDVEALYQCIYNPDRTRFVAFFTKTTAADEGNLGISQYTVEGIEQGGQWHYQKKIEAYSEGKNVPEAKQQFFTGLLLVADFFKAGSAELDPDFWRTKLFGDTDVKGHGH